MQDTVTLSALAIVATIATALVWLLQKQFTQNDTTIKESTKAINKLADVMESFADSLKADDIAKEAFQAKVITVLDKISRTQDDIKCTTSETNKLVKEN